MEDRHGHDHNHGHDCHDHDHKEGFLAAIRGHKHEYNIETKQDIARLVLSMLLNGAYGALQLAVGYIFVKSMILVTDAFHNLTDMVSLGIPLAVILLRNRYKTAPLLLTWFNYILLFLFLGWAMIESCRRLVTSGDGTGLLVTTVNAPYIGEVNSGIAMAFMAGIGIVVNLISVVVLHEGKQRNLNMKSAFDHQMADLVASAVAVIASFMIAATGWRVIDPLLTVIASFGLVYIVWPSYLESWQELPNTTHVKRVAVRIRRLGDKLKK